MNLLTGGLLTTAASSPENIDAARKATWMFTLVALSLGVLLLATVLLIIARRARRREGVKPRVNGMLVDPWSEAARRVRPFDSQDRGE